MGRKTKRGHEEMERLIDAAKDAIDNLSSFEGVPTADLAAELKDLQDYIWRATDYVETKG